MSAEPDSYEEYFDDGIVRGVLGTVRMTTYRAEHSEDKQNKISGFTVMRGGEELSRKDIKVTNPVFADNYSLICVPARSTEITYTPAANPTDSSSATPSQRVQSGKTGLMSRLVQESRKHLKALVAKSGASTNSKPPSTATFFKLGNPDRPQWEIYFDPSDQGGYPTGAELSPDGDTTVWTGIVGYAFNGCQTRSGDRVYGEIYLGSRSADLGRSEGRLRQ